MSEATIEYKNSPNESTAYTVSEGQKTKVQLVATPAGDLELADNPNVDTGYLVINGEKHKCALVAEVAGELKLPTSATDDSGYVTTQDGRQHKVKLVANIAGGGGATINNQDINVTQNGTYQAEEGYTGLGIVNVNVPSGSPTEINNQNIDVTENGVYTADAGYTGLGTVNVNVPTGGGGQATKFGVSIDNLLGDVDENGTYVEPTEPFSVNLAGVKSVPAAKFAYKFRGAKGIERFMANDLVEVGNEAFNYCLYAAGGSLTGVFLDAIEEVNAKQAFASFLGAAAYGKKITISFSKLKKTNGDNCFSNFYSIASGMKYYLDEIFPSLEEAGGNSCLSNIINLSTYRLSKLKKLTGSTSSYVAVFGSTQYYIYLPRATELSAYVFYSTTKEVHFAAQNQATIEALPDYATKFGGTNATIFFDLMLTITVNGVAYEREHTIDGYTSWKDASGNLVYTDETAEPAVGTVVYSDQGTTQVGTVEGVA